MFKIKKYVQCELYQKDIFFLSLWPKVYYTELVRQVGTTL